MAWYTSEECRCVGKREVKVEGCIKHLQLNIHKCTMPYVFVQKEVSQIYCQNCMLTYNKFRKYKFAEISLIFIVMDLMKFACLENLENKKNLIAMTL